MTSRAAALAALGLMALSVAGAHTLAPQPVVATAQPVSAAVAAAPEPSRAEAALAAFVASCPKLTTQPDRSGLTRPDEWAEVCAAAARTPAREAEGFFQRALVPVRIETGRAFLTGYFEPEIAGSRVRTPDYTVPVYGRPPDLATRGVDGARANGRRVDGRIVPHFSREEIEQGALSGQGLVIGWAADPIELFFIEIQGSGRLRLPDGGVLRIGYHGQNGHPYTAIGAVLRQRDLIPPGSGMQEIVAWMRANPAMGRELMRENASFVFFRELTGPGPLGAMEVAVTPRATVAVDPAFTPMGAPVLISASPDGLADGVWIAQDTGGAIKGANRFDTFWGAGDEAQAIAGPLQAEAEARLMLPRAAAARLGQADGATP